MDFDRRRFVHAEHLIGIEVGLLDTAVLERDLATKGRGGAEDNSTLDLRLNRVGVYDGAAIDRTYDAANTYGSLLRDK